MSKPRAYKRKRERPSHPYSPTSLSLSSLDSSRGCDVAWTRRTRPTSATASSASRTRSSGPKYCPQRSESSGTREGTHDSNSHCFLNLKVRHFDCVAGVRPERGRAAVHVVGEEEQGERQQNQGSHNVSPLSPSAADFCSLGLQTVHFGLYIETISDPYFLRLPLKMPAGAKLDFAESRKEGPCRGRK